MEVLTTITEDILLALVEDVIQTEIATMDIITIKKVIKKAFSVLVAFSAVNHADPTSS